MPLDALVKQYAGAYAEGFEWPQPSPHKEEEDIEEREGALLFNNLKSPYFHKFPFILILILQKWNVLRAVHQKQWRLILCLVWSCTGGVTRPHRLTLMESLLET